MTFVLVLVLGKFFGGLFVPKKNLEASQSSELKSTPLRRSLVNSRDYSIKCLMSFKETAPNISDVKLFD